MVWLQGVVAQKTPRPSGDDGDVPARTKRSRGWNGVYTRLNYHGFLAEEPDSLGVQS